MTNHLSQTNVRQATIFFSLLIKTIKRKQEKQQQRLLYIQGHIIENRKNGPHVVSTPHSSKYTEQDENGYIQAQLMVIKKLVWIW
ncbi:hypothetical protein ACJX0J_009020, partial [Zea mays]